MCVTWQENQWEALECYHIFICMETKDGELAIGSFFFNCVVTCLQLKAMEAKSRQDQFNCYADCENKAITFYRRLKPCMKSLCKVCEGEVV